MKRTEYADASGKVRWFNLDKAVRIGKTTAGSIPVYRTGGGVLLIVQNGRWAELRTGEMWQEDVGPLQTEKPGLLTRA